MTQATSGTRTRMIDSPVSNEVYDLLQALTSKLEAIAAYQQYRDDASGEARQVFDDMLEEDRQHAERLLDLLRTELR